MKCRRFAADFESVIDRENMKFTEVWAAGIVEIIENYEDVKIFNNLDDFMNWCTLTANSGTEKIVVYFHNLKFDGNFILSYLFRNDYTLMYQIENEATGAGSWIEKKRMPPKSFSTLISRYGVWYSITIKTEYGHTIEIRDSLKLIPFKLEKAGEDFNTRHRKSIIEYEGKRAAGQTLLSEEIDYIKNDVLVLSECLLEMFKLGLTNLTIGSCALAEYKNIIGHKAYDRLFPDLTQYPTPYLDADSDNPHDFGAENADEYIRKAYRGGWCYVAPDKQQRIINKGMTLDVNSLYPSMMSARSGNAYPVGEPYFFIGKPDPDMLAGNYWYVRIKTRFYLKPKMLPFVQLKTTFEYKPNEMLTTSDLFYQGKYYAYDYDGSPITVILTLSKTDYLLFYQHYDLEDFEILDGVVFRQKIGVFDKYIEKYRLMKIENNDNKSKRTIAKLMLVSLYGKLAASTESSYKVPRYIDGVVHYYNVTDHTATPGYIAAGAAITSYARAFTIRAAQANYKHFCYSDTDSLHLDTQNLDDVKGVRLHDADFCAWKIENRWARAYFVRQKTYIERNEKERILLTGRAKIIKTVPKMGLSKRPALKAFRSYTVACAGMPENCKRLFLETLSPRTLTKKEKVNLDDDEKEFLKKRRDLTDFDIGLTIPGKLMPQVVEGGVVLAPENYTMI